MAVESARKAEGAAVQAPYRQQELTSRRARRRMSQSNKRENRLTDIKSHKCGKAAERRSYIVAPSLTCSTERPLVSHGH